MTGLILVYALLVAIGGIVGYVKAGSQQSLISGLVSGVVLAIAWFLSLQNPAAGFALAAFLALGLLIVFTIRFRKTGKFMPAGLMAVLSLIAMVIFAVSWLN
ncbi:TMEM14 family protein [Leptodesmis sp.]|uniref:TMEM14 family protein n=1 Tax=Leptodesmis sp. TaxID=3100501 RepID=UPI0040534927